MTTTITSRATLILDEPRRAYAPGDSINGWVTLPKLYSGASAVVVVTLFGRAKVKVVKRRHNGGGPNGGGGTSTQIYRSRAALATAVDRLIMDPSSTESGPTSSHSFSLVVPATTQALRPPDGGRGLSLRSYWDEFNPGNGFPGAPGHPLPPTFKDQWRRMSTRAEAYVEYHLSAVVVVGGVHGTIASDVPIRIAPVAPSAEKLAALDNRCYSFTGVQKIQSLRLLPENADRQFTFKEKTKQFFKSSSLPVFTYKVTGLVRRQICVGDPVRLELQMQPLEGIDPKAVTPPQPPPVTVKQVDAVLHAYTVCRTNGLIFEKSESHDRVVWSRSRAINKLFDPQTDCKQSIDLGTIPVTLPPTFATYNVRVHYILKIKVKTMCTDELHTAKGELQTFLLGRRRAPVQPDVGGASSSAAEEWGDWGELTLDDVSEELPSYQAAMAPVELSAGVPADLPATAPAVNKASNTLAV